MDQFEIWWLFCMCSIFDYVKYIWDKKNPNDTKTDALRVAFIRFQKSIGIMEA